MSETSPTEVERPRFRWRRLLQFRLRTLLIVVTLLCVWMGWWSYSAKRQREAVAALRGRGDIVRYDFEANRLEKPPFWPRWLVDCAGIDYFANVETVILNGDVTDPYLTRPHKPTDSDLACVQGFTYLKQFDLNIRHVSEARRNVGRALSGGTCRLYVDDKHHVTDFGVEHLKRLDRLQSLDLGGSRLTDSGLIELRGLTSLQSLSLIDTEVTDLGLIQLWDHTGLQALDLSGTKITDRGLGLLEHLTGLKWLNTSQTLVTDAGVAQLQQALPNCKIVH